MAKTVTAKKRLGQHFLVDLTVAQNIADTVDVAPELPILEVGPGMGVLTRMLLEKKGKLLFLLREMRCISDCARDMGAGTACFLGFIRKR